METAEQRTDSTEEVGAVSVSPSTSLLGWHDFAADPPTDSGLYLCIDVMLWCDGKWWTPVCETQPVLYWRELPPKPNN